MRYIRYIFTTLLLFLLFTNGNVVLSMNTGFSTASLPKDDIDIFLDNINLSMLTDEPTKKAIECFDVNGNGMIAIGCSDFENKTVCIYTSNGDFQYGYRFECSGNFGIELDENVLNIYFVRSDVAIAVNPVGEVESILRIQNTSENNSYWNHCVFLTKRKIEDTQYIIKNDMNIFNIFASSYSQLISINKNGEERVIYDVGSAQFSNMVTVFIGVLVFICLVAAVVIGHFIKIKRAM